MESSGPTGPSTISYIDVLSTVEYLTQKEAADKAALDSIATITFDTIRSKLIQWASAGFPATFPVYEVPFEVPSQCSDGVTRAMSDYILFVSGKTLQQQVTELQARFVDMSVSFYHNGSAIVIAVTKM